MMKNVLLMMAVATVTTTTMAKEGYNPGSFFQSKTVIIPKDQTRFRGGEDSADSSDTMLVVADGVGGWAAKGINPGLFSQRLTLAATLLQEKTDFNAANLVKYSCFGASKAYQGTATVTILRLIEEMRIDAANLGDCGYALFHVNAEDDTLEPYFISPPKQYTHNMPYQCGAGNPTVSDSYVNEVRDGDVVLVYSDGFSDNVYPSGMLQCIEEYTHGGLVTSLSRAADCLARKAYFLGKIPYYKSPFQRDFKFFFDHQIPLARAMPPDYPFMGGKQDDITVTVAQVFADKGPDDSRRFLSAFDPYFVEQKKIYEGNIIPSNENQVFRRARFHYRPDAPSLWQL